MNWIVGVLAIIAALNLPQRAAQLGGATPRQRVVVGVGLVAFAVVAAAVATPLLDALDISSPTMEVGAGLVLVIFSAIYALHWDTEPPPSAFAGGLVPLLFPLVLTPVVGVTILAVAARNGFWLPVVAVVAGAAVLTATPLRQRLGTRAWSEVSALLGAVVGVVMTVDGALAV